MNATILNAPAMCSWPTPMPWGEDPELERLRHLERQAQIEQEKAAIRDRLRRMGYPDGAGLPGGPWSPRPRPGLRPDFPAPMFPRPHIWPLPIRDQPVPLTVEDVIKRIPH